MFEYSTVLLLIKNDKAIAKTTKTINSKQGRQNKSKVTTNCIVSDKAI